jgi:hypothetical protein
LLPRYNFDCQSLPFDFAAQARHRHPAERKCDLHCVTQTQGCVEVDTVIPPSGNAIFTASPRRKGVSRSIPSGFIIKLPCYASDSSQKIVDSSLKSCPSAPTCRAPSRATALETVALPGVVLAGEFFHIVQGLSGNDPAILLRSVKPSPPIRATNPKRVPLFSLSPPSLPQRCPRHCLKGPAPNHSERGACDNLLRDGYRNQERIGRSWLCKRQIQLRPAQSIRPHPSFLLPRSPQYCQSAAGPFHLLHFTKQLCPRIPRCANAICG